MRKYAVSSNDTWYTDNGASSHITHDLANIRLPTAYTGQDQVSIGNGAGLPIEHIGSGSSSSFKLNTLLHCPSVSHNLLSVHQFTSDNHCYFIFTPSSVYVKDLSTGRKLFQGKSENCLYPFQVGSFKFVALINE